jgi:hypothetical protein
VLRKVSTADSVKIWLYPAMILGWIQKGDKLPLITIQPELMESRRAMGKPQANRARERWVTWHEVRAAWWTALGEL